jgi:hypothetical protein
VVAFVIADPKDPYRYIQVSGPIVAETEEGGADSIRDLNQKYRGNRNYPLKAGDVRVIYKVEAQHISPAQ